MERTSVSIHPTLDVILHDGLDNPLEYEYLIDQFNLHSIENAAWGSVWKVLADNDPFFKEVSTKNMSIRCAPSWGHNHMSAGAMYYRKQDDYVGELAILVISLRNLARVYQVGQSNIQEYLEDMITHELCHLKMFQEVGEHEEDTPQFQGYLQDCNAPVRFNWTTGSHVYP